MGLASGCSLDVSMTCERGDRHDAFLCRVKAPHNANLTFPFPYRHNQDGSVYFDYVDHGAAQTVTVSAKEGRKTGSASARVPAGSWYSVDREQNRITVRVSPGSKVTLDGGELTLTNDRAEAELDPIRVATLDGKVKLHELVVVGADQVKRAEQLDGKYGELVVGNLFAKGADGSLDWSAPLQPGMNRPMLVLERASSRATHPELPASALERIAVVTVETETLDRCPGMILGGTRGSEEIWRSRDTWTVVIREARTYKELARKAFKSAAGRCPRSLQEWNAGVMGGPSMKPQVDAWLTTQ